MLTFAEGEGTTGGGGLPDSPGALSQAAHTQAPAEWLGAAAGHRAE